MTKKATHYGECQLCGREQMLPNGKLAKHGYTTRWGFFSGTCPGSDHLPYEQGADLLPPRAAWAAKTAKELRAQARAERAARDPKTAWVHHYVSSRESRDGHSRYEWRQVEVSLDGYDRPGYSGKDYSGKESWVSISVYDAEGRGSNEYLANVAASLNAKKAAATEASAKQHAEYAEWATKRFEAFKPRALKPIAEEVRREIVHLAHPKFKEQVLHAPSDVERDPLERSVEGHLLPLQEGDRRRLVGHCRREGGSVRTAFNDVADALSAALATADPKKLAELDAAMTAYSEKYRRSLLDLHRIPGFRKLWDGIREAIFNLPTRSRLAKRMTGEIATALSDHLDAGSYSVVQSVADKYHASRGFDEDFDDAVGDVNAALERLGSKS